MYALYLTISLHMFLPIVHWEVIELASCLGIMSAPNGMTMLFVISSQTWGGKQSGFGLAECCRNIDIKVSIPELYTHIISVESISVSPFILLTTWLGVGSV